MPSAFLDPTPALPESSSPPLSDQRPWWWPYTHRTVVQVCVVLFALKIAFGLGAGIAVAAQNLRTDWIWVLGHWNLTYEFAWSELTEGEGSLFWNVTVNGYTDDDPKNIAKFPLYPAVTRALWDLSGRQPFLGSALILSFLHTGMVWAGIAELYRFWEAYRPGYGQRAIFWVLLSPLFTFQVWLASYMEPGFIALLWLSLTLEYKQKWAPGSAALFCLTMLQPSGVIIACFLGVRRLIRWMQGQAPLSAVLWALLPGVAWGVWMVVTSLWLNRLLAPYAFQAEWGRNNFYWPWDQWLAYLRYTFDRPVLVLGHVLKNVSIAWVVLGYIGGALLWIKLPSVRRERLGGWWAFPLFSVMIVVVPFCTIIAGVNRYALTSLLAVWPMLFSDEVQDRPSFRDFRILVWMMSAFINFLTLYAFLGGYRERWELFFG